MKIGSVLYYSPLYLTLGLVLAVILLTQECRGVVKQYCRHDADCVNKFSCGDNKKAHSCCDLDYEKDEDFTLYCWCCEYSCNADRNYCQNQINGEGSGWKWVYPSKDKGTRNSSLPTKSLEN